MIYLPYAQDIAHLIGGMSVAVRSDNDVQVSRQIREELARINPNLPVVGIESMDRQLDAALLPEHLTATVSASFSVVALLLACIGLYGTISFRVARRRHEIGVRL